MQLCGVKEHRVSSPEPEPTASGGNLKPVKLIELRLPSGETYTQAVPALHAYSSMVMVMAAIPGTDLETLRLGLFSRNAEMQAISSVCTSQSQAPMSISRHQ